MYLLDQSALTGMSDQSLNCSSFDGHQSAECYSVPSPFFKISRKLGSKV